MPSTYEILFKPDGKKVAVRKGQTVLDAAIKAGLHVDSLCGGHGECGKCKVKVSNGSISIVRSKFLSSEEMAEGYCLACQTIVEDDLEVFIPEESRAGLDQILTRSEPARLRKIEPVVKKIYLELPKPSLSDNVSDIARIRRAAIKAREPLHVDLDILQQSVSVLRRADWKVTVTIAELDGREELIGVSPGDTAERNFGLAVDIGTTTIVVELVDLIKGAVIDTSAEYNKQMIHGEDVLSRILFTEENEDGLSRLQHLVIETINKLSQGLIRRNGVAPDEITCAFFAGNTTMIHLFLGIRPSFIRQEPYIPAANFLPFLHAGDLGININPKAAVYCMPCRSSYVGGDITADILASSLHRSPKLSMLIDVGTNGEVVLGNKDWIVSCSCSAGPAFEGGEVEFGMRASKGAIEKVALTGDLDVQYRTIGNLSPRGICGSGLIDLMSELFMHRVIDRTGKIQSLGNPRVREGSEGGEFVVAWKEEASVKKDIVVTEVDIKNILRTKAAVYAAATVLLKKMGFSFEDVERIFIAGGFGNYLEIPKAVSLGLLPDVDPAVFKFIGNGSVAGARLALLSKRKRKEAEQINKKMTYIELSVDTSFYDEFISALFLPHTNVELFPSVKGLIPA